MGIGFYVCSVPERSGNALLGLAVLVSSLAWSYWNPILVRTGPGRRNPGVFEGVLLYVAATGIANLLRFAFGQLPLGW